MRRLITIAVVGIMLIVLALIMPRISPVQRLVNKLQGEKTVEDRLRQYGPAARTRLGGYFEKHGVNYPPKRVILLVLKEEKILQLYAEYARGHFVLIKNYPILAASGECGPKLCEGDCQVPEGIYRIVFLNPNSLYHLSMRLDYPNSFDRKMARVDGRTNLGSDIMIHGSNVSIGCIAMGDKVSEDLFVMAADVGIKNIEVVIAPYDLRKNRQVKLPNNMPKWTKELYRDICGEMNKLPQ
ncbi:MAG: L,D-transpeptidase family protein [Armatimonadota bacterium]